MFWETAGIYEERTEGVNDGSRRLCFEAVHPRVLSGEVNQGKSILISPRTGAFAIADVHTNYMKGLGGMGEEFAMVVTGDSGHVPNGKGCIAFMDDVEASAGGLQIFPIGKSATAK
jgi:hypothetical protein